MGVDMAGWQAGRGDGGGGERPGRGNDIGRAADGRDEGRARAGRGRWDYTVVGCILLDDIRYILCEWGSCHLARPFHHHKGPPQGSLQHEDDNHEGRVGNNGLDDEQLVEIVDFILGGIICLI